MNSLETSLHNTTRPRRGFTAVEAAAVLAVGAVAAAVTVPMFQRLGCSAARTQSRANLAQLFAAHEAYAADFNDRQLSLCPDNLGSYQGNWQTWQQFNGCAPAALLGTDANGQQWSMRTACGVDPGSGGELWLKPMNFTVSTAPLDALKGAFRLGNVAALNQYVDGRYLDAAFFAPDDPAISRRAWRKIQEGADYEAGLNALSTYTLSPAAMYDPRVFGDGSTAFSAFLSPDANTSQYVDGYRSPTVSQCQHPALKTRLMEMWAIEGAPSLDNPYMPGGGPHLWNQSILSRPLTAFFDGSVRMLTPLESKQTEQRVPTNQGLWLKSTPFGAQGYFGSYATDFLVNTSAHFLTRGGIRGRDTLALP